MKEKCDLTGDGRILERRKKQNEILKDFTASPIRYREYEDVPRVKFRQPGTVLPYREGISPVAEINAGRTEFEANNSIRRQQSGRNSVRYF